MCQSCITKSLADTRLKIILKVGLQAVTKIYCKRTPTTPQPNHHLQKKAAGPNL